MSEAVSVTINCEPFYNLSFSKGSRGGGRVQIRK